MMMLTKVGVSLKEEKEVQHEDEDMFTMHVRVGMVVSTNTSYGFLQEKCIHACKRLAR